MRSLVVLGIITLAACVTPTPQVAEIPAEPTPTPTPQSGARSDACVPLDGDPANCCPSRLGLDTELIRDRCGWTEYLGERSESSCLHVFRDAQGAAVELRVVPIVGLELARAIELHEAGFVDVELAREVWPVSEAGGEITWTSHEGRNWAFVPGWPQPRRVSWLDDDCADDPMRVVLQAMSRAPVDPAGAVALPEFDVDLDTPVALAGLLLDRPTHDRDATTLRLPDDAPVFAEAVLDRAAADDLAGLFDLLLPGARWGLPDRRQLGGRPIGSTLDDARPGFVALRRAAARLTDATLTCPVPDRRMRSAIARGEHPQWCFWVSADELDVLALALRSVDGHARLEYLGVFPERPSEWTKTVGEPPPPPLRPAAPVVCGDPHHHDVVRCPELAEPEESPPDQANQRPASTMR
jgi:hypothetical protein